MCIDLKGGISDSCWSYVVGESTPEIDRLMEVTKKAMYLGIEQAQVGNRISLWRSRERPTLERRDGHHDRADDQHRNLENEDGSKWLDSVHT